MNESKRIAAIYDIHGNLPALEAVLREIEIEAPDLIVVGGDVAAGPLPRETIERLQRLDVPARFIRGNADREMAAAFDGRFEEVLPPEVREITEWVARQITVEQRDFLAAFEQSVVLQVDGLGETIFCHATPRSDLELFTVRTPDELLREIFGGVTQSIVVCGHTHMQFDRRVGDMRLVNAGSVGMPYGAPGAYWALLGPGVQLRRTAYDLQVAADRIRQSSYPGAEDFAENNVLRPPTTAEALAFFEG